MFSWKIKEFLLQHSIIWSDSNENSSKRQIIDDLSHKVRNKWVRLNTVIENHILWVEELLLECDSLFSTAVCSSYDATVLYIKVDDILKFIHISDFYSKMKDYWYDILRLFNENLEKWTNLEKANIFASK